MTKKGFTLIELLAVIVILAVIAVITVPRVAEQIESSREGGAQDSFYGVIQSAELSWAEKLQDDSSLTTARCRFGVEGEDVVCENDLKIKTSGALPSEGVISITNKGHAYVNADESIKIDNYYCCGEGANVYCERGSKPTIESSGGICQNELKLGEYANVQLEDVVVEKGDGLYDVVPDEGEEATEVEKAVGVTLEYLYKGKNPNNYITFDNEVSGWRIMGVTKDGNLKLRRNHSLGEMPWDYDIEGDGGSSSAWPSASLNKYLNETYYKTLPSMIVKHNFEVGRVVENNTDLLEQIKNEKASVNSQYVGLMTVSDYILAGTDMELCGNLKLINDNHNACKNYLTSSMSLWTLNEVYTTSSQMTVRAFYVGAAGEIRHWGKHNLEGITPVVYLSKNITLSGRGTVTDPFEIGLK